MAMPGGKKIAIIEDDRDLAALLRYNLEKEGFTLAETVTGQNALELCLRERPDLVLLDIMLPDADGLDTCKAIRNHPQLSHLPVIFLTARASEADRIVGLEMGANDYVVKPFFVNELVARIKFQLRLHQAPPNVSQTGTLELNRSARAVFVDGAELELTATEFRLLEYLMSHAGVAFSREQLLDAVWGRDTAVTHRTVDVYVLRLRKKIEPDPSRPTFLRSMRGFGYRFGTSSATRLER